MASPVLVPVDGSAFSEQALPLASDLARRSDAPLHIVQVHTFSHPVAHPEIVPPYQPDWETSFRIHEREHLTKLRQNLNGRNGLTVTVAMLEGPIVDRLVQYVEDHHIGHVVMTSHGRGGLSRAWLGSVASELVRLVGVPVLLTRPSHTAPPATELSLLRHILIPVDGSALSESIVTHAVPFAKLSGARITLIEVVPPVYSVTGMPQVPVIPDVRAGETARNETARYLEHLAGVLRCDDLEVDIAVLTHWRAAHGIIDYAHDHDVDMIAMATHGRGAWSRFVVGSVADKVLRGCEIPVLVLRPPEFVVEVGSSAAEHYSSI